jgi:(2Fe-2S) ferredoxin
MVLVLPEDVWYWRVAPEEVPTIAQRHLRDGQPIAAMLYPVFHAKVERAGGVEEQGK